ncbi:NADH-quinone oxidoreductase subunit L [Clostridium beijerinckii]|uniref:NADH-quinone oxidoreductase subunit L n=1 Tax=Clostridium beijerinckii TaxID=1520 RepID=UPI0017DF70AA|nr:NADH-quinone oxidoreductase subunit L [Clostridium beijerinckii]NOW04233.1 NADH-quinone oxidoreductase subunit L [Clostridium beijerinckii]NYC02626.1 NADH-quinone oxidoreductase subunit L [Clostridium beijerinckii]
MRFIDLAWMIPIFPAIAFLIIGFISKRFKGISSAIAIGGMFISLVFSVGVFFEVITSKVSINQPIEYAIPWLTVPIKIEAGVLIDPLTAIMLLIVTFIGLLVEIYSLGYMKGEEGFSRFFANLSLFSSSMLGLVISNNYFQMFFFWELVGLCSYLLIGFYYDRPSAVKANKKAFVANRVGDFGFLVGMLCLFMAFGTFNFRELAANIPAYQDVAYLTIIALLIFAGPMAKSAQFPLHVWLPDAMEGPTPVSALIHAATMVAAGVYLLARGYILFSSLHEVSLVIAYIGGITAFVAGTIALVQRDLKRILAFSTMSQLGYMVMAMGVGGFTSGMFHLTSHAFFKALLFLGAGSIIHAIGVQDIFKMGGLIKKMKLVSLTFIIASLSLAGIPPLSGFFSKDEILTVTYEHGYMFLYYLGLITAFLTAFYMSRLIFIVFFGEEREKHSIHKTPWSMTIPLIILSVFSVFYGFINETFASYIYFQTPQMPEVNLMVIGESIAAAFGGILLGWLIYGKKVISSEALSVKFRPIHQFLFNQYYLNELYQWIYEKVVLNISYLFNWCDRNIVDGIFDNTTSLISRIGAKLRLIHSGRVQNYALIFFVAIALIILWLAAPILGGM